MSHKVFLSIGSNIGVREQNIMDAMKQIDSVQNTNICDVSNIYETDPVGYVDQGKFLNAVISLQTDLEPLRLLEEMQRIEILLKRTRDVRWGPRTIDIDILLYDNKDIYLQNLIVPHPRMFERAFVLIPLKDVYTEKTINNFDIDGLIDKCSDKEGVKIFSRSYAD